MASSPQRSLVWSNVTLETPEGTFEHVRLVVRRGTGTLFNRRGVKVWEGQVPTVDVTSSRRATLLVEQGDQLVELTAIKHCGCRGSR